MAFGQGTVNFSAGAATNTRLATNSAAGGPTTGQISGAGNYYFALFVAPTSVTSAGASLDPTGSGFTFFGAYGTNTAAVGRFTGNPTTDDVAVPGYGPNASANFVVVGWSANIGVTWASFSSWYRNGSPNTFTGWAGESAVAQNVQLGGGLTAPGNIFGSNPGQVLGFTLGQINPVPEPTTFALAGLGAAALVIFRRRKA